MRFDIIRQPLSVTFVISTLLLFLFWGRHALLPIPAEAIVIGAAPLGCWINSLAAELGGLSIIITIGLTFINAIYITRIITNNMVLAVRTYTPVIIYIIVSCGIYMSNDMLCVSLSAYLLIRASQFLFAGFRRSLSFDLFFRGTFLIGLSSIIYAPITIFFVLLLISLRLLRRSGRESMIAIGGGLLPILICSYIYWAVGYPFTHAAHMVWDSISTPNGYTTINRSLTVGQMVFIGAIILTTSLSLAAFATHLRTMRAKAFRIYLYHIYMLVISIAMMLLPCSSSADYAILAIPLAVIMPTYFVKHTGVIPILLWFLLTLSAVVSNILAFCV